MSELVESPNSFYVNCSQYNDTSAPIEALIKVEDRQDILKRSDDWMVNVVRWTLDTQSSLFYLPADPSATVTMELFGYTRTTADAASATRILETRQFTLSEGQATVSTFLQNLNAAIPQVPVNVAAMTEAVERNLRFHGDNNTWAEYCGRWLVTSDGKFRFNTHMPTQTDEDLFIRVKMSESMRTILGFQNARIYTLTQQSRLVDWKAMINFLYEQFVAYRADVGNFRFALTTGLEQQNLSPWEQHVKNGIVPWMERVTQIETNRALSDAHTVRNREITLTTTALVDEEMVFAEYTSANIAALGQGQYMLPRFQHKKTLMGKIAHTGSLLVNRRPTFQLTTYMPGHAHVTWQHDWFYRSNTNYVQGAGAGSLGAAVVADHDAPLNVRAMRFYTGIWSRSYILAISGRHITLNRGVYTAGAINDDGGQSEEYEADGRYGPVVGQTLYLASHELEEQGAVDLSEHIFRRMTILVVSEGTLQNDHNATVQNTWEVIVDDYIAAGDVAALVRDPGDSVPKARVAHTDRRAPWDPLVQYNQLTANSTYDANTGLTTCTVNQKCGLFPGSRIYFGVLPTDSVTEYMVEGVHAAGATFTVTGDITAVATNTTYVVGFQLDSVYAKVAQQDLITSLMSASAQFIDSRQVDGTAAGSGENHCILNHTEIGNRIDKINDVIATTPSIAHWGLHRPPHRTWSELTEAQSVVPANGGISAGGEVSFHFNAIATVAERPGYFAWLLGPYEGWSLDGGPSSGPGTVGGILWPSFFYLWDMPTQEEDPLFHSFMATHISEDLKVNPVAIDFTQGSVTNANGVVVTRTGMPDNNAPAGLRVTYRDPRANTADVGPYQVAGITNSPLPGSQRQKLIVYCPTLIGPGYVGNWHMNKYNISVYKHSAAAVAVLKNNNTISFANNDVGVNLQVNTGDMAKSALAGQVDLAFVWKAISITSQDLLHVPERSGDHNTRQPILSSYNIPSIFTASTNPQGEIVGSESTPFGSVSFSEGGARRYHALTPLPGGLRTFQLAAELVPKDSNKPRTRFDIPPHGRFSVQLLFVQKKKV